MVGAVGPSVVCLGVFDGVHLGHRALVDSALRIADEKNLLAIVHTYEPLPMSVIAPGRPLAALTTLQERMDLLAACGPVKVAVSHFDSTLQQTSGEEFFHRVLLDQLNARHIVVGFNHRFGRRADTDVEGLKKLCLQSGTGLTVIEPVQTDQGLLVSSSAIRAAITLGDLKLAEQMLGRPPNRAMIDRVNAAYELEPKG